MKVSIKQYSQTLFDLTEGKSEQEILNVIKRFADVLKKDGQIKNFKKIVEKFSEIWNVSNGVVEAEVFTVDTIEQAVSIKIEKFIKEKYLVKKVIVKNIVDKKIKGGIIIRIGDEIIDGSINAQLNKLKNILSK